MRKEPFAYNDTFLVHCSVNDKYCSHYTRLETPNNPRKFLNSKLLRVGNLNPEEKKKISGSLAGNSDVISHVLIHDRTRSTSGDRSKERSPSASSARRGERNPSAAVRMARQSAKDQMRAAGLAREKGEADMEEFIKDRDDVRQ